MTQEEQLIALLEWMGWTKFDECSDQGMSYWRAIDPKTGRRHSIPPLTLDLMHEAELRLFADQWEKYGVELERLVVHKDETDWAVIKFRIANATKEQRLEALLKTIGKWRDE